MVTTCICFLCNIFSRRGTDQTFMYCPVPIPGYIVLMRQAMAVVSALVSHANVTGSIPGPASAGVDFVCYPILFRWEVKPRSSLSSKHAI